MTATWSALFSKQWQWDKVKEYEMEGECDKYMVKRNAYKVTKQKTKWIKLLERLERKYGDNIKMDFKDKG